MRQNPYPAIAHSTTNGQVGTLHYTRFPQKIVELSMSLTGDKDALPDSP